MIKALEFFLGAFTLTNILLVIGVIAYCLSLLMLASWLPKIPESLKRKFYLFFFPLAGITVALFGAGITIAWLNVFPFFLDALVEISYQWPSYENIISVSGSVLFLAGLFFGAHCVASGIRLIKGAKEVKANG